MQPLNEVAEQNRPMIRGGNAPADDFSRANLGNGIRARITRRLKRNLSFNGVISVARRPRALAAMAFAALLGAGFYLSGEDRILGSAFASMSSSAGFSVTKMIINGNQHLEQADVEQQLSGLLDSSIIGLDVSQARTELAKNRWVKGSTIKKVYPDTLVVDLVEREPVALWKSGGSIILISREGFAIDAARAQHMHLPQVVGEGANTVAAEFLTAISRYPELVARADAYVRVADRRWNVVLDDGMRIMLPSERWQDALAELNQFQREKRLLDRELIQIDMRLPDRLVLKLEPEAAELRKTRIQKIMKRDWHKT